MATGTGTGFDLTKLESQFKKLDDELKKLMKEGADFETKMNTIFNNMGQAGLQKFAQELAALRKGVVDFGKQKVGIKWDSEGLKKYIDDVNRLMLVIKQTQKETKKQGIKGLSISGLKKELKEAQELLRIVKSAEKTAKNTTVKRQQTYAGSIRYSNNVKTLEQERQAIRNLEAAREKLKTTDKNYETKLASLNSRIKQHNKNISDATKGSKELQEKHRSLMDTSGQLARALAAVFSVSAIKGYINKIVEVRGEFELQHRSLQAIIQDVDKANKLWDKTVALAVKSPFRVKDLVTYTKQLAAYQIESDKLYDTTKKLADVSAGLGVDMNRLILAYGQVKAANFLRGTELRQFTEAGIPMLDELAKYFSEMENKFVSAADVFERISKRGVSFEDVDEVFNRITGEGGIFYQMQEKQSETLKGMINNLRDSIDLMLNDIGKSQEDSLKGIISSTKSIVDNWRYVGIAIKQVGFAAAIAALRKLVTGWKAVTLATFEGTAAMTGAAKAGATLRLGLQKLFETMTNHPWAFVFAALAAGTHAWINHKRAVKEANEAYDDAARTEVKKINSLKAIHDQIEANNNAIKNNSDKGKENTEAIESNKDALAKLKAEYPDVFNGITQNIDGTVQLTSAIEEQNKILRANIALQHQAKGGSFYEGLKENYEDAIEARSALYAGIEDVKGTAEDINQKAIAAYDTGEISKEAYDNIMKYLDLLREAEDASDIMNVDVSLLSVKKGQKIDLATQDKLGITKFLKDRNAMYIKLDSYQNTHEKNFKESLDRQMSTYKNMMKTFETDAERGAWLKEQLENLGIFDNEMQEVAKEHIIAETGFAIKFPDPNQVRVQLKEWQEEYNRRFGDKEGTDEIDPHASFVKIRNIDVKQTDVISRLQYDYKETKDLIDRINAAGGEAATAAGGAYEGLNVGKLTAELNQIQEQIEWFGAPLEKKQKKSIEILNRRISLIKEMYEEYNKVHQESTAAEAKEDVAAAYKDTFIQSFEGTGINFSGLVIDRERLTELKNAGNESGSVFSEAMLEKINEVIESGTYIRKASEPFKEALKGDEGLRLQLYDDKTGKVIKDATDWANKVGTATIGWGHSVTKLDEATKYFGRTITEAEAQQLLDADVSTHEKSLNTILDKYRELILTQEQYDALLNRTFQGGATIDGALKYATNIDAAIAHFNSLDEKLKRQGMTFADEFGEDFIDNFKNAESVAERLALVLRTINLTTKASGSQIDPALYKGMKARSEEYASIFRGDLEIVKLLDKSAIDVSQIDFTNIEGVIAILQKLKPLAEKEGKEAELALSRAISEFEAELNIKPKIEERESIERSIDELFGNYEISLEMDKLNIPSDFASKVFGFESVNLDDIRKKILDEFDMGDMTLLSDEHIFSSEQFENLSEEQQKLLKESLKKEDKLQNKHLEDNLKKYIKYSKKALSERAKIKVDEMNHLREIEDTFRATPLHDIETARMLGLPEAEIQRMEEENKQISERNALLTEYLTITKESVAEQSIQQMNKIEWDEFRSSDVFINMFNDLDKASEMSINAAIDRIKKFKEEWKDMPVAAAKEMLKKLNELQLALYDSSNVRKDKKKIEEELNKEIEKRGLSGKANTSTGQQNLSEAIQGENQAYTEIIEKANKRIELLQLINSLEGTNKQEQLNKLGYTIEYLDALGITTEMVENTTKANDGLIKKEQEIVDNQNDQIAANQKILNLITKQKSKAAELGEKWSKMLGMAKDLYTSFQDLSEAANWDFSDEMAIFGEMGTSMADAVINAISLSSQLAAVETGAIKAGTALNTALGIVGLIVMAVQLVASALNAISTYQQEERAEAIENEMELVEELAEKYEDLKESIDKVYSSTKLKQDSKDAQANLEAQIAATERAIAVYEEADEAKLTDEEQEDWEEKKKNLEDLKEQAEELKETIFSISTGGVLDDVASAADSFVDAWLTAFEDTENGMTGLEESFDDMLKTILKKQISLAIMGPFINDMKTKLGQYLNENDTELTADEAASWVGEVSEGWEGVNANMEAYLNALKEAGIDLFEKENELSGLSGGIQGMTEEQADILAAYWNAVRFSTDSIDNKIETVISKMDFGEGETSMIDNIRLIRINSDNIYELLQKVSTNGGSSAINVRLI